MKKMFLYLCVGAAVLSLSACGKAGREEGSSQEQGSESGSRAPGMRAPRRVPGMTARRVSGMTASREPGTAVWRTDRFRRPPRAGARKCRG